MNLGFKQDGIMRFTQAEIDGSKVKMMFEKPIGSGYPSIYPNGKFLITDTYCFEPIAYGDGSTPIRLVNLEERTEKAVCRIQTKTPCQDEYVELRLDPHPVWGREFKKVIFNAFDGDTRRVYIADLENFI